jgi:hydrogenase maturation protease
LNVKSNDSILKAFVGCLRHNSTAVIGLGNPDRADDAVGILLAAKCKTVFPDRVFLETETSVEGAVLRILDDRSIGLVWFVDAVGFGGAAGEIRKFEVQDADQFVPAISTHKVPMSLLMNLLAQHGKTAFLLGIQPGILDFMGKMSDSVSKVISDAERYLILDGSPLAGDQSNFPLSAAE